MRLRLVLRFGCGGRLLWLRLLAAVVVAVCGWRLPSWLRFCGSWLPSRLPLRVRLVAVAAAVAAAGLPAFFWRGPPRLTGARGAWAALGGKGPLGWAPVGTQVRPRAALVRSLADETAQKVHLMFLNDYVVV